MDSPTTRNSNLPEVQISLLGSTPTTKKRKTEKEKNELRKPKDREYYQLNRESICAQKRQHHADHREKLRARCRAYYQRNKEARCAKARAYNKEHRGKRRALQRAWREENRKQWLLVHGSQSKKRYKEMRLLALQAYGGACKCCGEIIAQFLAFDHINGGGNRHRKQLGQSISGHWLKKHNYPPDFRILCHSCNMAKGLYGSCPHEQMLTPIDSFFNRSLPT
jgi:hypothetical protein